MDVSSNAYVGNGRRVAAHYKIAWVKDMLSPTPRRQMSAVIFLCGYLFVWISS